MSSRNLFYLHSNGIEVDGLVQEAIVVRKRLGVDKLPRNGASSMFSLQQDRLLEVGATHNARHRRAPKRQKILVRITVFIKHTDFLIMVLQLGCFDESSRP
jgi:hypothetical protein